MTQLDTVADAILDLIALDLALRGITPSTAHIHKAPDTVPELPPRERFPFTLVTETGRCTVHVWGHGKEDALRRFRQMRAGR